MARQIHRIIVEGMDGSGKTTFIEKLMLAFPQLELTINTKQDKQTFDIWWPMILEREQNGFIPIHDRFFYSELVYGPILRGKINAPSILVSNVLWFLRAGSFLIYARPHSDVLRETIKINEQMEGVTDNFAKLLELYDELMMAEKNWYTNRFLQYDFNTEGSFEETVPQIRRYINGELG